MQRQNLVAYGGFGACKPIQLATVLLAFFLISVVGRARAEFQIQAGANIEGKVIDVATKKPVVAATVIATTRTDIKEELPYSKLTTKTDSSGSFAFKNGLSDRRYVIAVDASGYPSITKSISFPERGQTRIMDQIELWPFPPGPGLFVNIGGSYQKLSRAETKIFKTSGRGGRQCEMLTSIPSGPKIESEEAKVFVWYSREARGQTGDVWPPVPSVNRMVFLEAATVYPSLLPNGWFGVWLTPMGVGWATRVFDGDGLSVFLLPNPIQDDGLYAWPEKGGAGYWVFEVTGGQEPSNPEGDYYPPCADKPIPGTRNVKTASELESEGREAAERLYKLLTAAPFLTGAQESRVNFTRVSFEFRMRFTSFDSSTGSVLAENQWLNVKTKQFGLANKVTGTITGDSLSLNETVLVDEDGNVDRPYTINYSLRLDERSGILEGQWRTPPSNGTDRAWLRLR